jgi:lipopolysaccharide export system protein LptA
MDKHVVFVEFRSVLILTILLLVGFHGEIYSQSKTRIVLINADQLVGGNRNGEEMNICVGNVIFEHDSAFLYCDSAVLFSQQNNLEAHHNVQVKVSDTMNLYGDVLFYEGNSRVATITGDVILEDNDATLYTDRLIYERNTGIAYYKTHGRIISDDNELTSKTGYYHTDDKMLYFKHEVLLVNPDYTLKSDTLIFNSSDEIAYISGPTVITGKDEFLYSEKGLYETKTGYTELKLNSYMTYKEQYLSGDTIYYYKQSGMGEVFGNVFIKDTLQDLIVTGNYADYRRKDGYAYATDSAEVIMMDKADSLFMHADTLRLIFDSTDSPAYLLAYYKCRFFKTDLQGMTDSLVYAFADSTINMYHNPVLWTQGNQLTAEQIEIFTSDQKVDSMYMTKSSFIISLDKFNLNQYNQIKGKSMVAYFEENELNLVKVSGNSETIYYVREEEGGLIGINKAASGNMEIWIEDRQVIDIYYFDTPDAQLYPEEELPADQQFLRDFIWRKEDRPLNRSDIFVWPANTPALR